MKHERQLHDVLGHEKECNQSVIRRERFGDTSRTRIPRPAEGSRVLKKHEQHFIMHRRIGFFVFHLRTWLLDMVLVGG